MMQTTSVGIPQINITEMSLDGYSVIVPQGLSDLLNASGAWGLPQVESDFVKKYDRKVEMRNGKLVTVLTKKI